MNSQVIKDFLTDEQREELLVWALAKRGDLMPNPISPGRFAGPVAALEAPAVLNEVRSKIEQDLLAGAEFQREIFLGDFLSFNEEGASINMHTDPTVEGYTHYRANVLVQMPYGGGNARHGENEYELTAGDCWWCDSSSTQHGTTAVEGDEPRINISIGYLVKDAA